MSDKKKVVCIAGPTASGKTKLSVCLAKEFGGEIICADSMQIYKNMPIASAAPTQEEKQGVKHRLFEFLDPDISFNAADYCTLARKEISDVINIGKIPFLVGGTGLYISSLADNIRFCETDTDFDLRKRLEERCEKEGVRDLISELEKIDPETASRLHPNNTRRIIRALELYYSTGKTMTELNEESRKEENEYDYILLGLKFSDRQKLYDRIDLRVDKMLECGLLEEARKAFLNKENSGGAAQAIGHKEFFGFFENRETLSECTENLKRVTRRYAKRQLSWFNRDERIIWLYPDLNTKEEIFEKAKEILEEKGVKKQ